MIAAIIGGLRLFISCRAVRVMSCALLVLQDPFWLQGLNLSFANCPIIQFGEANYQNYQKQEPHLKMSSKPITYAVFDQYVD